MASNLKSFNLAVGKYAEEAPAKRIQQIHRAVGLEALRGVVLMTPVDTGRARANWQVTQDNPATGEVDVGITEGKAGVGKRGKRAKVVRDDVLARGAAEMQNVRPFGLTWIVNNVPYISQLESGSSQQAPAGMLAVTATRLRAWLKRVS